MRPLLAFETAVILYLLWALWRANTLTAAAVERLRARVAQVATLEHCLWQLGWEVDLGERRLLLRRRQPDPEEERLRR